MNTKKHIYLTLFSFLTISAFTTCSSSNFSENNDYPNRDCLYQVSTLQALMASYYYGVSTIADFMSHGDIGLGTFESANGEMIVLDGVCYQALSDGTIAIPNTKEKTPFAAITWFDSDYKREITTDTDLNGLKAELDKMVALNGANTFYAGKIKGVFPEMSVRTIAKQNEPFRTLDVAMSTDQIVFNYKDVKGTLIALYCPSYSAGINAKGWHIHFLSEDKKKGGHVLSLKMSKGNVELDRTDYFHMELPSNTYFDKLNLSNQDDAIEKVEKGK